MLLGRLWLREAKVKHDWYKDRISLWNGKKMRYIEFGNNQGAIKLGHSAIYVETFNMKE